MNSVNPQQPFCYSAKESVTFSLFARFAFDTIRQAMEAPDENSFPAMEHRRKELRTHVSTECIDEEVTQLISPPLSLVDPGGYVAALNRARQ
jgi:hypothetical protein